MMTTTPQPTDKRDAATTVAVRGPADDPPADGEPVVGRQDHRTLRGLLEPDALKGARPVLRGAERSDALRLPECAQHDQQLGGASPPWRR
jgi:hypothetical protein